MMSYRKGAVRRLLGRQTGASSVLVLLVLLLLVFLAVLAFVATGSNLRLARKNADTVQSWYRMDAEGERMAAKALQTVRSASEQTAAWLDGNRFLDAEQDVLSEATVVQWKAEWVSLQTEEERAAFRERHFAAVHAALAAQSLRKTFPDDAEVTGANDAAGAADATGAADAAGAADTTGASAVAGSAETSDAGAAGGEVAGPMLRLRAEDPEGKSAGHLEAVLQVLPAQNAGEGGHVRILSWRMVQAPFTYKNEIKLWEGIVE